MPLTLEQQRLRQHRLTGSRMTALFGSPWAGPIDVWKDMRGEGKPVEWLERDPLIRGVLFERPVIEFYALKTGRTVLPGETQIHPEHDFLCATPDGVSLAADGSDPINLEVKNTSPRMWHHWGDPGTDQIALYYVPQVQLEMACAGLARSHVVKYSGDAPEIYPMDFDPAWMEVIEPVARDFLDYVRRGVPPPPDASDSYADFLQQRFPAHKTAAYLDADASILPAIEDLRRIRLELAALEEQKALRCNQIKAFIGEHAGVRFDLDGSPGRIDWKKNKDSQIIDRAAWLEALGANPDDAARYTTVRAGARPFTARYAKENAS